MIAGRSIGQFLVDEAVVTKRTKDVSFNFAADSIVEYTATGYVDGDGLRRMQTAILRAQLQPIYDEAIHRLSRLTR